MNEYQKIKTEYYQELLAERDRYKKALEEIVALYESANHNAEPPTNNETKMDDIAEQALKASSQEESKEGESNA